MCACVRTVEGSPKLLTSETQAPAKGRKRLPVFAFSYHCGPPFAWKSNREGSNSKKQQCTETVLKRPTTSLWEEAVYGVLRVRATGLFPFRKIGVETGRYRRQLTNHIMVMGLVALPRGCVQAESQPPNSKEKLGRESLLQRKQPLLRVEAFCCVRV